MNKGPKENIAKLEADIKTKQADYDKAKQEVSTKQEALKKAQTELAEQKKVKAACQKDFR